ncbi:LamG-like jellyroll fold domain-containing protein [Luteolibacter sp. LG18]|uniref:LamG-like jellyroll fold domain-containing protein n=1 Tax=Luteolibacter sp. LG18 TaxID=2819286 RepID=UPI002B30FB97|nr:hypothetical protein llg_38870 [Luteolibacter sp. LG18]
MNPSRSVCTGIRASLLVPVLAACQILPSRADYTAEILSEHPIAYYKFSDGVTAPAPKDTAVNIGSFGTPGNALYSATVTHATGGAMPGNANKAATFNGRGFALPYNAEFNSAGSFSVEMWIQPSAVPATGGLVCPTASFHENTGTGRAGWLIYQGDAATGFNFRTYNLNGSTPAVNITSGAGVTAGSWHHVVATWDSAAGVGKLYVNGALKATSAATTFAPNFDKPFTLGARSDDAFVWQGSIDEPAYYTAALSDAQVLAHYNNGVNASPPTAYNAVVAADSPLGYWRLDEPVFNPTIPVATNLGTLGAAANGGYHGGTVNVAGPDSSSGFSGMGSGNTAVSCDGIDGYVGSALSLLNDRSAFTVMGWVKRPSVSPSTRGGYFGQNDLLEFGEADAGANIEAWINATGGNVKAANVPADDSTWGFIVLTGNGTNNSLYVNGTLVGTRNATVSTYGNNAFKFNIGGGGIFNTAGDFFHGVIDEVAVFDKAVTPGRVMQLYAAAQGAVPPSSADPVLTPSGQVMEGQAFSLSVDPSGTPPFTYQWKRDGVDIPGATGTTLSVASATVNPANPQQPSVYSVSITNEVNTLTVSSSIQIVPGFVWTAAGGGTWDEGITTSWKTLTTGTPTTYGNYGFVRFDDTASSGNIALSGAISPVATTFKNNTLTYTLTGSPITGNTGVVMQGNGRTVLATDNTYTGLTDVQSGVLQIGDGTTGSIPGTNAVTITGGELRLNPAAGFTYASPTTLASGMLSFKGTGDVTTTGIINGAAGSELFDRAGTITIAARNTPGGIVTINAGTVLLDGAQQFNRMKANQTVIVNSGGILELHGVNSLPSAANSINLTLGGGRLNVVSGGSTATGVDGESHNHIGNITLNGGTIHLDYSGAGDAYDGESFQLNGDLATVGDSPSLIELNAATCTSGNSGIALAGARSFVVNDVTTSPAADLTVNVEIEDNDDGGGSLVKAGSGTLAIGYENNYTGGTTVSEGTLLVNNTSGSGTGPGTVSVQSGGTIGGSGTIGGVMTVAGTIAPGSNGAGTLGTSAVALSGTYACEVAGSASDLLLVSGDLDLTGASLSVSVLPGGFTASSYVIAQYSGSLTGTFTSVPAGYVVQYYQGPGGNQITLSQQASGGYGAWATAHAGGQAANLDFDGDGVSNGVEYFMGANGAGFTAQPAPVNGVVTWPRDPSATVTSFKIQVSDTLAAGSWTDIVPPNASIDLGNPNQVKFTMPSGAQKKFCRLVVTP